MLIYSPSTRNSHAFLARAWKTRAELSNNERAGFSQYFYLTVCGHIEAVFAEKIHERLLAISIFITKDTVAPATFSTQGVSEIFSPEPIVQSVNKLVDSLRNDAAGAPISKQLEIFFKLFEEKISDSVGKKLYEDLLAIAALRNILAHGRDFVVNFNKTGEFEIESSNLDKIIKVLRKAHVIVSQSYTGGNWNEMLDAIYSDEAMLYFYKSIIEIEEKISSVTIFGPPKFPTRKIPPLPNLET